MESMLQAYEARILSCREAGRRDGEDSVDSDRDSDERQLSQNNEDGEEEEEDMDAEAFVRSNPVVDEYSPAPWSIDDDDDDDCENLSDASSPKRKRLRSPDSSKDQFSDSAQERLGPASPASLKGSPSECDHEGIAEENFLENPAAPGAPRRSTRVESD